MIIRSARCLLTRLLFLVMGMPITRYRKEVERLWSLSEAGRAEELEQLLARNRPLNSAGVVVSGLEALKSSPPLSKKQVRTQKQNGRKRNGISRFGRHTAGTTGEPTEISLTREELARMLGVRDYCFRHYGVKLGHREARLWGRPESGMKSKIKNFVMNRRVFHPVGQQARNEISALLAWQPDYLYGYASLLLEAAKLLEDMELEFKPPKLVVCTAESILYAQKDYISQVFQAPVAEEYGSTEFDVIAFECTDGHRHLVNPWLVIEGYEDCLITDVSRRTQNLIRYQLGDSLSICSSSCKRLGDDQMIEGIEGRTLDRFFYITDHEKIHATVFPVIFEKYFSERNEIFRFTIVQVGLSEINVFVDGLHKEKLDDLKQFIEREIYRKVKSHINVKIILGSFEADNKKRNYFVQNMISAQYSNI